MNHTLIVVDMQNDFVDGSLGSKEAETIVEAVVREIRDPKYDKVIATLDTHPENYLETFEGKHLPVKHCVKSEQGWEINPAVKAALDERKAEYIEKPTFGSYELVEKLKAEQPQEITLVGLCTDICVISNALMLRAAFYETDMNVVAAACAGTTVEKHEAALQVMASCQITIK